MNKYLFPVLTVITIVVSGCSTSSKETNEEHSTSNHQHKEHAAPELTYTIGSNDWSSITTYTDNPKTLEAYQFAVEHPEVLNYMPCYCGCFEEDGHTSNTHCFVDHVKENVVALDTMGFGWGVCVDIAREAKSEFEKGTPIIDIRNMIDEKYKGIGTPPTPTPLPET